MISFPAGEVAGATRVVAVLPGWGMADLVPRRPKSARNLKKNFMPMCFKHVMQITTRPP